MDAFSNLEAHLRRIFTSVAREAYPLDSEVQFGELALQVFALQYKCNSSYRAICARSGGSPQTVNDWRDIPAVPTPAFKEFEITCLNAAQRDQFFLSSGSTQGARSRHYHCQSSLRLYEDSLLSWFDVHFPLEHQKFGVVALTPTPEATPHSSLVHMFHSISVAHEWKTRLFVGSTREAAVSADWILEADHVLPRLWELEQAATPALLLGTAFNYLHLTDLLEERGSFLKLAAGSCALETGGYKGRTRELPKRELHARIAHFLGISPDRIVGEYGMSELSSQGYDNMAGQSSSAPGSKHFRFPPWARVRVISPETGIDAPEGVPGLIRVHDLANLYSAAAIQTEDFGTLRKNGLELLGRAVSSEPRGCSLMSVG